MQTKWVRWEANLFRDLVGILLVHTFMLTRVSLLKALADFLSQSHGLTPPTLDDSSDGLEFLSRIFIVDFICCLIFHFHLILLLLFYDSSSIESLISVLRHYDLNLEATI